MNNDSLIEKYQFLFHFVESIDRIFEFYYNNIRTIVRFFVEIKCIIMYSKE